MQPKRELRLPGCSARARHTPTRDAYCLSRGRAAPAVVLASCGGRGRGGGGGGRGGGGHFGEASAAAAAACWE